MKKEQHWAWLQTVNFYIWRTISRAIGSHVIRFFAPKKTSDDQKSMKTRGRHLPTWNDFQYCTFWQFNFDTKMLKGRHQMMKLFASFRFIECCKKFLELLQEFNFKVGCFDKYFYTFIIHHIKRLKDIHLCLILNGERNFPNNVIRSSTQITLFVANNFPLIFNLMTTHFTHNIERSSNHHHAYVHFRHSLGFEIWRSHKKLISRHRKRKLKYRNKTHV